MQSFREPSSRRSSSALMLGAMVCKDAFGNSVTLKTVSGVRCRLVSSVKDNSIYVPPVADFSDIEKALSKNDEEIHNLTSLIEENKKNLNCMEVKRLKDARASLTEESLYAVYGLYSFYCADGSVRSLMDICRNSFNGKLPPTGTGDCCAPKLLNYAFSHSLTPISMAEVMYGGENDGKIFSPCDARCSIILPEMLGLNIVYRDSDIVVVNKQSGLLSVPGRGCDKYDSVSYRLKKLFPFCIEQPAVHRLDMETSGLMVLALTAEARRDLGRQFEARSVLKKYEALLDGILHEKGIPSEGQKELYFRLDVEHRPHQIWDAVYGKKAVTAWKVLNVEDFKWADGKRTPCTRVLFTPLTGRTHQLRLLSADSHGFETPIIGDTLYGTCKYGERLMLHATNLEFAHPRTKEKMSFCSKAPF